MVRPFFDGIIGQETALELLTRAVEQQRIAPAYLFAGPEGTGRRLVAQRFAEVILHQRAVRSPDPAILRRRIQQRNHPDILWVEPTYLHQGRLLTPTEAMEQGLKRKSPPQVRLAQIRAIAQFLSRPPLESTQAVVVIEAAQTMAESAANGLLKTLEEPGQATLLLLSPDVNALLPTLVSRCQIVPFKRLGQAAMVTVLQQVGQTALLEHPRVMAMAQGSPGGAIYAYEQLQAIPEDLLAVLNSPPTTLRTALEQARQIASALDTEAQLWLLDYLQHQYWQAALQSGQQTRLKALEQAKKWLRSYVQPRLVWEVTLMALLGMDHQHRAGSMV